MNKHILFSNSARVNCWGGVEKWVVMTAKALREQGYQVHIICRKYSIIEERAVAQGIPVINTGYRNSLDILSVSNICQLISKYNINLIICSTNLDIKLAGLAGRLCRVPVISRQGLALISNKFKYSVLIKYFTDAIITNTYSIKEEYESYSWFPRNHIKVIYNGVETNLPKFTPEKIEALKETYHIPPGTKIILAAGRLTAQKGFKFLIQAAITAYHDKKNWLFLIAGDGNLREEFIREIEVNGLTNIRFLGFQENMHELYAFADVFILSSIQEGTPNVVLEAMAHKVPVIATAVNGVKEIMQSGRNGIIIPSRDSKAIIEGLSILFKDDIKRLSYIENAYKDVVEKYSIQRFTEEFIGYINDVLTYQGK